MLVLFFPLFLVLSVGLIGLRRRRRSVLAGYWLLLALSAAPYLLYVWYAWQYIRSSSFDGPEGGTPVYPGMVAFAGAGSVSVAGLLALDAVLLRRFPLLTALTPVVLGLLFRSVALPLLYWKGPDFLMLDNMPLIWLFAWSLFAAALLLVSGWLAIVRPARRSTPLTSEH